MVSIDQDHINAILFEGTPSVRKGVDRQKDYIGVMFVVFSSDLQKLLIDIHWDDFSKDRSQNGGGMAMKNAQLQHRHISSDRAEELRQVLLKQMTLSKGMHEKDS